MSLPNEINPQLLASSAAYTIDNSLRFRRSATAYLSRTPSSGGNRRTWTWSGWVKRGLFTEYAPLFCAYSSDNNNETFIMFDTSVGSLRVQNAISGTISTGFQVVTTPYYRDIGSWYHVVVSVDTTQAAISNAVKVYINGSQVTSFSTQAYGGGQNQTTFVNHTTTHLIGKNAPSDNFYADVVMAEVQFVDGQALAASSFGETDTSTGVWKPKRYTGSYGTNGFYQKYSDVALTSGSNAGLGKDFSGNGNYWNTNNISVTAGTTYDALTDSPTPKSATVGNYCTLNHLDQNGVTISECNLRWADAGIDREARGTMAVSSGKWYWEVTLISGTASHIGVHAVNVPLLADPNYVGATSTSWSIYLGNGNKRNNGSYDAYGTSFTTNDVAMCALDMDNGKIWWGKNGTWFNSGDPAAGTNAAFTNLSGNTLAFALTARSSCAVNFGQRPFSHTAPNGFKTLNTYNFSTPTIGATATTLTSKYFNPVLYTGTGSARSVTGVGFQPDWVWIKERSSTSQHALFDAVRGVQKRIVSDTSAAEDTSAQLLTAFNSDGFSVGTDGAINENSQTYVAWNWKAGDSNTTNTSGDITSTVRVNNTAGFSIVQYNGPTSGSGNKTIGHGLGVAPAMIFVKSINYTYNWDVYHQSLGYNASLILNSSNSTRSGAFGANPTSTVFTATQTYTWDTNINYVAYCFAEISGFSRFGGYTGNGSSDGVFVHTGFRPKFVMVKCTSNGGTHWVMVDTSRNTYNVTNLAMQANLSDAEQTGSSSIAPNMDLLSNGFKLRTSSIGVNGNGYTYIFMAFAENPFKYSLAR